MTEFDNQTKKKLMALRRPAIFTAVMAIASFIVSVFWIAPFVFRTEEIASIFSTALEEDFFYDIFAWAASAWLLTYICSACELFGLARFGQWGGIILLSVNQVVLSQQCSQLVHTTNTVYIVPMVIETYVICLYGGFFMLPSLAKAGYLRLTGISTIAVLVPWLVGKQAIVLGSQVITGLF